MEHAIETMMFVFHKFAENKGYLAKEDLRVLKKKEFPGLLENQKEPLTINKTVKDLDKCQDSSVGFQSCFKLSSSPSHAITFVIHMKERK